MQERHPGRLSYRPDIDGLRAIAILLVVVFHFFPARLPGGFIGVDVFFVISGFLISRIIFRKLETAEFSFAEFYAHRARRIFPALITVLLAGYAAGWFMLLPDAFGSLGKHMAGGAAFVQNIVLLREHGYFDTASELKPLLHLWSLAIEEQFYLLYPLLVWTAWRLGFHLAITIGLLCLLSFALNIAWTQDAPVKAFFLPLTRFWELFAGGMLAWLLTRGERRRPAAEAFAVLASASGLLLIATALVLVDHDTPFPGWSALLPVIGACLLIAAGPHNWINKHILGNRAAVFIGLISYPLYLWHWPIISLTRIATPEAPSLAIRAAGLLLSFVLAFLTYRLIERPIRFGARVPTLLLCVLLALTGGFGYHAWQRHGYPERYPPQVQALLQADDYDTWFAAVRTGACHLQTAEASERSADCIETRRPLLMLWGDSHAASLYPGLHHLQNRQGFGIAQFTQAGCGPVLDLPVLLHKKNCNTLNRQALAAARDYQPEILILHGAWLHAHWPIDVLTLETKLRITLDTARSALPNTRIIVIGPVPQWHNSVNKLVYELWQSDPFHRYPGQYMRHGLIEELADYERALAETAHEAGVGFISARAPLCTPEACMTRLGPEIDAPPIYVDFGHLTTAGSIHLVEAIRNQIFGDIVTDPASY
ncbi:acyltransferase family protein [Thauera sp. SDU_THAU2]|uniref:acyltransferase family protein n=1 Tax=Thauera sp. SDU_THAU2 TaxID=3136633 RepID=UPI00311E1884